MCLHITYIKGERIERCLAIKTCPLNVLHPYKVGTFFPNPESSPLKVWNLSSTLWIILVGFLKMQVNEPFTSFIVASHTILQPRLFLELLELLEPLTLQNRFFGSALCNSWTVPPIQEACCHHWPRWCRSSTSLFWNDQRNKHNINKNKLHFGRSGEMIWVGK